MNIWIVAGMMLGVMGSVGFAIWQIYYRTKVHHLREEVRKIHEA